MKSKNSKKHWKRNLAFPPVLANNNKNTGIKFVIHLLSISFYRICILLLIFVSAGCNPGPYVPDASTMMIVSTTTRGTNSVPTPTHKSTVSALPSVTIAPKSTNTPTPTSSPKASPTIPLSGEIAYTAYVVDDPKDPANPYHWEAYIFRFDDLESYRVPESPNESFELQWSPDGNRIAYLTFIDNIPWLHIFDFKTRQTQNIENVWTFDWSKDSQSLVYCEFGSWALDYDEFKYYIARVDDLSNPSILLVSELRASELHWSPAGDRILAVGSRQTGTTDLGDHIFVINLRGEAEELYTQKTPHGHVAWHPNGNKIAYDVVPDDYKKPSEIRIIDLLTLEEGDITSSGGIAKYPEWSPDGKKLAYQSSATLVSPPPSRLYIYILDLETGKTIKLVGNQDGHMTHATWSPDGQYLAFLQGPSIWPLTNPYTGASLNIYDLLSGKITTVLDDGVEQEAPTWKP